MTNAAELMQLAIDKAAEGMQAGQSPFGCAVSIDGEVVAVAHNTVVADTDITAHAEVNAIRQACRQIDGILLTGALVATTCEPCPMCMAALHWARVGEVHFGATIADATAAGFNELHIPATDIVRLGRSQVKLRAGMLAAECQQLFARWQQDESRQVY